MDTRVEVYQQIQQEIRRLVLRYPNVAELQPPDGYCETVFFWWNNGRCTTAFRMVDGKLHNSFASWCCYTQLEKKEPGFCQALQQLVDRNLELGAPAHQTIMPGEPWVMHLGPLSYHELALAMEDDHE